MAARRRFNREFKVEAVKLVQDRGMSIAQAAHGTPTAVCRPTASAGDLAGNRGETLRFRPGRVSNVDPCVATRSPCRDHRSHTISVFGPDLGMPLMATPEPLSDERRPQTRGAGPRAVSGGARFPTGHTGSAA